MALRVILAILVLALVHHAAGLSMTVYRTECVQEMVEHDGDTVSGNFIVLDHEIFWASDHPGIDFVVTSPHGAVVSSAKGSAGDNFKFVAPRRGMYKFCFHNTAPSPETVDFYIHVGHIPNTQDLAKDEHLNPVNVKIAELREALLGISAEQHFLRARVERHHRTNQSTQRRLMMYTGLEYAVVVAAAGVQIFWIRRLFNRKAGDTRELHMFLREKVLMYWQVEKALKNIIQRT